MSRSPHRPPSPGIRLWPAVVILTPMAARLFQIWFLREYDQQFKVERSVEVLRPGTLLLLAWFILFSRLTVRTRIATLAGAGAAVLLATTLVRIRGFDGDRLPILEWRWSGSTPPPPPPSPVGPRPEPASRPTPASDTPPSDARWPRLLGPSGDGVVAGPPLATDLIAHPPRLVWRQPVGAAWAGFAIDGPVAVTLQQAGDQEEVIGLRLQDGGRLWSHRYAAHYQNPTAGDGPRSVPTISRGRVYTTGATGILTCLDLATGGRLWQVDLVATHHGEIPLWGYSASPLVSADQVIVAAGGPQGRALVAHDALTGSFLWGAGDFAAGHASPTLAPLSGTSQILLFHAQGVSGHDPTDGRVLWNHPVSPVPHVAQPLPVSSNRLVISSGYGVGAELLELTPPSPPAQPAWAVRTIWASIRLKAKFCSFFARDGHLYGLDDGMLTCVEEATGQRVWKETRYGHGQLLWVGENLLVFTESGELAILQPTPQGPSELSRARLLQGRTWNPPALAGTRLLVRTEEEAACFELATRTAGPATPDSTPRP